MSRYIGNPGSESSGYHAASFLFDSKITELTSHFVNSTVYLRDMYDGGKQEMVGLNDRLAAYMEKVVFMEIRNKAWANVHDLVAGQDDWQNILERYDQNIQLARDEIDRNLQQSRVIEADIDRFMRELADVDHGYADAVRNRDAVRDDIRSKIRQLADIRAKIMELKDLIQFLQEEVDRIKRRNNDIAGRIQNVRNEIATAERAMRAEQADYNGLLNECDALARAHQERIGMVTGSAALEDIEKHKLPQLQAEISAQIRIIREQYERELAENRSRVQNQLDTIVSQLRRKWETERLASRDELENVRAHIKQLQTALAGLQGRNCELKCLERLLREQLEETQRANEKSFAERDIEIRQLYEQAEALTSESIRLTADREALEQEIATYRKILEGAENRAGYRAYVSTAYTTTIR